MLRRKKVSSYFDVVSSWVANQFCIKVIFEV